LNHPKPLARLPTFSVWQGLVTLGAWARHCVQSRYVEWRQTKALGAMDMHQLQDIGAPAWLQERAYARLSLECYEHFKATARLKY
jgi:hypothetical protein